MDHPGFFDRAGPFSLADVAAATGSELAPGADARRMIVDVRPLSEATAEHVSFIDNNKKFLPQLSVTTAGACLVSPLLVGRVPSATSALVTKQPYHGFARALALFYPQSMRPMISEAGAPPIHPTAKLEEGVEIEPGAVIGREASIGRGARIAANAVIGARVAIGRGTYIGAGATIAHALVGDRVIIHAGVRIGQDGFGFAMARNGHLKVPQIGRVIIQDDVEIGANTTIDRGALKDTIIGEGTKIDNLVQIGHNAVLGRHCVIVAQTGISGSAELGDFVVMGGQSGVVGHIKVGDGAQIAGTAHPTHDVPAGARMAGTPAKSLKVWAREIATLKRIAERPTMAAGNDPPIED
ncbi:MAG: UDP-3-O-(3-hydroxymyristoyl)glucosamine N-acyltransferase [Hyphomicrobium sp.]